MSKKEIFLNREISWLAFNNRVFQEAADNSVPLIDRLRFLGIFSNNLDEFYRVRVATVQRMVGVKAVRKDFYDKPKKLLAELQRQVVSQQQNFDQTFTQILKGLQDKNVFLINEKQLSASQKQFITAYFQDHIRPALVPIMLNQVNEFPTLKDKSIYFAIKLSSSKTTQKEYAILEIPNERNSARFVRLPDEGKRQSLMLIDDIIRYNLLNIFSAFDYDKAEAYTIKVTRDAELNMDNDVSQSFIDKLYKSVKNRQKGVTVRLAYDQKIQADILAFLMRKMKLKKTDNLVPGGRYHNFRDFIKFPDLGRKDLAYPAIQETYHPLLSHTKSFFDVLKKQDILLQYPYQSFSHFIDFLREAAIDPEVSSIKITLYRAASNSRVVNALVNAAKNGKKVIVVVELQARFDEEANIKWGQMLQEEGVQVIFGISGLKVHSKLCLIERIERRRKVLYANVATGNYNEQTSHTYSDQALFTCDTRITKDAERIFEYIENPIKQPRTEHLVISPFQTRNFFVKQIQNEIHNHKKGKPSGILLKMNSLVDDVLIEKLYEASKAGVKIRLIIRGICRAKAGVKGLSENIEIISIIDRFLEHSRVFRFENAGKPKFFISSADFMTRNLDVRLEVSSPIYNQELQKQLDLFLETQWQDNVKARIIDAELSNKKRTKNGKLHRSQIELMGIISKA
ncbi:MAG TPA: polyphosphate kinase 1 [Chitinophagales bacterium]